MNPEAVFKRYDIRGEYPEEVNEEFAERIGKAVGSFALRKYSGKITVSKDNKRTSENLKDALIEGIISTGCKVYDAGTGPTDYAAFTGRERDTVTVQITSSHLPLNFNGFKFIYPEGNGFTNPDLDKLKQIFRDQNFQTGKEEKIDISETTKEEYKESLKQFVEKYDLDFNKKIIIDTLGGATNSFLPEILEELGAEVVNLAEGKKNPYRDPPNPKPELLGELKKRVEKEEADLGIATDMDGDRLTVYRDGFLEGDKLFGIFAQLLGSDVVASIDTSESVEKIVSSNGKEVFYTRVGDPFVLDRALKEGAELAGEPNGHYAFLDFVPYPSGILSSLLIAGLETDSLLEKIPDYETVRQSVEVEQKEEKIQSLKEEVEKRFSIVSELDGVKFDTGEATVLARTSGSSPKIRIIAESRTPEEAEEAVKETRHMIQNA